MVERKQSQEFKNKERSNQATITENKNYGKEINEENYEE